MSREFSLHRPASHPSLWPLDRKIVFLNHGSFGCCPRPVLDFQRRLRDRLERQPVQFFVRDLEELLDRARGELARFVGAPTDALVFVPNATAGVNTVLRSLTWKPGDELLVTDHEYNACRNALDFAAQHQDARVVVARVPFPLKNSDAILDAILSRVTKRTRLALIDHVTSQTGLIQPVQKLAAELGSRGIDTLIDGAHAPGMIPLNLRRLGATYYTGNCHKWLCAPKTAGFLYVTPERQSRIRPLSISHGANTPRTDRSRYQIEFGWPGTWDPSACLSVPESIRCVGSLLPGGWPEVRARNRALALAARKILCDALEIELPCPDSLIGALASLPIPDGTKSFTSTSPLYTDPIQDRLLKDFRIEVPIIPWPVAPRRLLRISAQLYNALPQYERLAAALSKILAKDI